MHDYDIPEGATHRSIRREDPTYYKEKMIAGHRHWFWFDARRGKWLLSGHRRPHWTKSID